MSAETLRVRVSFEGEGYRTKERLTELELASLERQEALEEPAISNHPLRDPARFQRATLITLGAMLPLIGVWMQASAVLELRPHWGVEMLFALLVPIVVWGAAYARGEGISKRLGEALRSEPRRVRVEVRPRQSLTLIGSQHRGADDTLQKIARVRVEDSVVEAHKTLYAEYEDGTEGVLLADVSEEELGDVRSAISAHGVDV